MLVQGVLRRDGTRLVCDVSELKAGRRRSRSAGKRRQGAGGQGFGDAKAVGALGRAPRAGLQERRAHEAGPRAGGRGVPDRNGDEAAGRGRTAGVAGDGEGRPTPRVPEPEPAALAHRAFRAQLAAAPDIAALQTIIREIEAFFPRAVERSRRGAHEPVAVGSAVRDGPGGGLSRSPRRRCAGPSTAGCGPMPASG